MKPIPAIDENGEFVEATLRNGEKVVLLSLAPDWIRGLIQHEHFECDICWYPLGNYKRTADAHLLDIIDLPAVRERVERAMKMREARDRVAMEEFARRQTGAPAKKEIRKGRVEVKNDGDTLIYLEHDKDTGWTPIPKRPSFAEALESDLETESRRSSCREVRDAIGAVWAAVRRARAASGE